MVVDVTKQMQECTETWTMLETSFTTCNLTRSFFCVGYADKMSPGTLDLLSVLLRNPPLFSCFVPITSHTINRQLYILLTLLCLSFR